ncbi:MAG: hypothetical protein AB1626_02340 [Candidatus Micrarchaeota archaeon]
MAGKVLAEKTIPELRRLQSAISVSHRWGPFVRGRSIEPEQAVREKAVTHHFFTFHLHGVNIGHAMLDVNHRAKSVEWAWFFPREKLGETRGLGVGTAAHLLALKELAAFHPKVRAYKVMELQGSATRARASQLKSMGLGETAAGKRVAFSKYLRRSNEYARRRFGFSAGRRGLRFD